MGEAVGSNLGKDILFFLCSSRQCCRDDWVMVFRLRRGFSVLALLETSVMV